MVDISSLRTISLTEVIISNLNNLQEFDYENMGGNLLWMSDDMFNSRTKAGYLGKFFFAKTACKSLQPTGLFQFDTIETGFDSMF